MVLPYGDLQILSEQHLFWSGFWDGDATARVRESNGNTGVEVRVQAGSNGRPVRQSCAFRVQIGSKQKSYNSFFQ